MMGQRISSVVYVKLLSEPVKFLLSVSPSKGMGDHDDILVGERKLEEHNKTLETVFQRASDFEISFDPDKRQFEVPELQFYGHQFTKNGSKPKPEKVKAIKDTSPPESKDAVRSFLGMMSKFIPRYSSLTTPLWKLTHNNKFKWGSGVRFSNFRKDFGREKLFDMHKIHSQKF